MSTVSTGPEAVSSQGMATPKPVSPGPSTQQNSRPVPKAPEGSTVDVVAETTLREPITSVAMEAQSERASSLASIEDVADDIREAIDTLNAALAQSPTKAIISRDEQLNRFIVKIADKDSGEVIREVPNEAVQRFARNLQEIKGLLFDKLL